MLFQMPQIHFFLRSNNDLAKTNVLYCRVTINYDSSEFSTKEKISRENWDQKKQFYHSKNKKETQFINALMDSIRYKIKTTAFMLDQDTLTAKQLIELSSKNRTVVKEIPLLIVISDFICSVKKVVPNTIRNHWIKYNNLKEFEKETGSKFVPSNFDVLSAHKFITWFQDRAKTKNVDTANRNILFFKQALQWAVNRGELKTFALLPFQGEKDKIQPPVFLTTDEVIKLIEYEFQSPMLRNCKDLYLFQIATGLSYCDLWSEFTVKESPSGKVLQGVRNKNEQTFFVPLDELGCALLAKYGNQFPVYCNAVYNRVLKEIAGVLGINKRLTTHTGRKTFATLRDADGWSRESVSRMLGHKNIKTTEVYYLGQSNERIMNEFEKRSSL